MLEKVITTAALLNAAGARYFRRGEEYFESGRVKKLAEEKDSISAKVHGSKVYDTRLSVNDGKIEFVCTCPLIQDGIVCKHCVAVGLAWLDKLMPKTKKPKIEITRDEIRGSLLSQDKEELVKLLMERADRDETLNRKLVLSAASRRPKGENLNAFKAAISSAFEANDFVHYRDMRDYAQQIHYVVVEIEDLLSGDKPETVIELCEYALKEWEAAIENVDDSNGEMSPIRDQLQEIHLNACRKAQPNPEELARKLFEWELNSGWEVFLGAALSHADVLGKNGLAVYRQLAEKEWKKISALGPKSGERWGSERFRITYIMESLAKAGGDIEALVEVKKRDLSSPYSYLEIAKIYKNAGKSDIALEWAERGLKDFPTRPDSRVRDFLAEEYQQEKRQDDAMKMVWENFIERSSLETYERLKKFSGKDGWNEWREKALAWIREDIAARRKSGGRSVDHSLLVEIYLSEKDPDGAWQEAKAGGCAEYCWMRLAEAREKDHPEDALEVCRKRLQKTLDVSHKDNYREAIAILRKMRELFFRFGRESEFDTCLAEVKATNRARPSFMKMLERARF